MPGECYTPGNGCTCGKGGAHMTTEQADAMAEGVTIAALEEFFAGALPLYHLFGIQLTRLSPGRAELSLRPEGRLVRPGGGVAGPIQFAMVDVGFYAAVFTLRGIVPMAVTSDLGMHFLRPARSAEIRCVTELVKIGRRLAYGEARLFDQEDRMVSRASGSYALPTDPA